MEPKEFLTAHDVISAGACRGGVLEWCIKKCFFLGTTKEALALALASGTDAEHIEKAAGLRGNGDGFGFGNGDGDGFGNGDGYGFGDGFGNGDGDGFGFGDGFGDGFGFGDGNGFGFGDGNGDGDAAGDGNGDGFGGI